jgi:hypothetical protein
MEWVARGLLSVGLFWFVTATFIGGARSLLIGAALFVAGVIISVFA